MKDLVKPQAILLHYISNCSILDGGGDLLYNNDIMGNLPFVVPNVYGNFIFVYIWEKRENSLIN